MKVTIVGAGNVGATCADVISYRGIASEVVLVDIKEGFAEGKAMDIMQCATTTVFNTQLSGTTGDYSKTAGSDVVVITSGIPRKPGMTREELIGINAGIVKSVADNVLTHSPNAIIVVVSNPMDTMTYLTLKATGLPKNRVIGMGGALDSSRFKYFLSKALDKPANDVQGMVIGGHGDTTMIPLTRLASYNGVPVSNFLSQAELDKVAIFFKSGNGKKWLDNAITWIYRNHFTYSELKKLVKFYKTPAGQKMATELPLIMVKSLKAGEMIKEFYPK